jgi:hypothetical protein
MCGSEDDAKEVSTAFAAAGAKPPFTAPLSPRRSVGSRNRPGRTQRAARQRSHSSPGNSRQQLPTRKEAASGFVAVYPPRSEEFDRVYSQYARKPANRAQDVWFVFVFR